MEKLESIARRSVSFDEEARRRLQEFVVSIKKEELEKELDELFSFESGILFSLFDRGNKKIHYGVGILIPAFTSLNRRIESGSLSSIFLKYLKKKKHRVYQMRFWSKGELYPILEMLYNVDQDPLLEEDSEVMQNHSHNSKTFSSLIKTLLKEIGDGAIIVNDDKETRFLLKVLAKTVKSQLGDQLEYEIELHCRPDLLNGYSALVFNA